ncbi:Alpha-D-ribose 1-methylphosphonate 5-triphosphate diphosphatase [Hyphomicrobiales bacterium]|nr:Alpha-D-ribose 1-methylphosphonate 5-triphosphate diphosphatase [Hyphomicrobiales bacterium]CAH1679469.1 Alpha-D-ribose 1-methylphosphonate 5-triphosphate diphosphatase [Hyphomicrobiales bacterium]
MALASHAYVCAMVAITELDGGLETLHERWTMNVRADLIENARLVLPDQVLEPGWLAIHDGVIVDIGEGRAPERGIDLGGDFLLPGFIELHTDHLESHFHPRPRVRWHPLSAVMAYDAQIIAAGVTTVFDSLRAGSDTEGGMPNSDLWSLAEALDEARDGGYLRAEHRTHLRCEVATHDVIDEVTRFAGRFPIHVISLMDHTPGQRQFRDVELWKIYFTGKTARTEAEANAVVERRLALHQANASRHRRELVAFAQAHDIALASHDDATAEHVVESIADGVAIAEFPTTHEAAGLSHEAGIRVMMGGPNVVRGGSHSGNIAAEDLAREGLLDIISSDYVPASLAMAVFMLAERVESISLPEAVRMITLNPARAAGLHDRGAIAVGQRADCLQVHLAGNVPIVRRVWRQGEQVV